MGLFNFRRKRISVQLPAQIHLLERRSDTVSEDHHSGVIVSVSRGGACLVVEKVILGGEHIFFKTQDQGSHLLLIKAGVDEIVAEAHCESIWMDSYTYRQKPSFRMGLKFLTDQKKLYTLCRKGYANENNTV